MTPTYVITGTGNPFSVTVTQKGGDQPVFRRSDSCADSIFEAVRQVAYTTAQSALEKFVRGSLPVDAILVAEGQFPVGFLRNLRISYT